jgi:hypothetical protein
MRTKAKALPVPERLHYGVGILVILTTVIFLIVGLI